MRILFIGYSSVAKRRILPFLNQIQSIEAVDIAKFDTQRNENIESFDLIGQVFDSYKVALEKSQAEIAYISNVNSAHAFWTENALKRRMHVIVDKPAFLDLKTALEMTTLAEKLDLCLAEATVYSYHPQISKVIEIIHENNLSPANLTINFSFPPMIYGNFRYSKDLGGGAFNDLGPYAVSPGRIFFNAIPEKILCSINDYDNMKNVELSFSVIAKYSNGRSMTGNFGFTTEYINRLNILGPDFLFEINRVFTPPVDSENEILFKMKNKSNLIRTGKSNSFINFIRDFIDSVNTHDYLKFRSQLIMDAKAVELLKKNILS
jgi:predicted dehydrogenase